MRNLKGTRRRQGFRGVKGIKSPAAVRALLG